MPIEMPRPQPKPPKNRPVSSVIFTSSDDLWQSFENYRDWCKANPVEIGSRGRMVPQPMTVSGFAVYLGCGRQTLYRAADRDDLRDAWERVKCAIDDQLIAGGLVRNLDGMLVARVAGLADRQHVETTEAPTGPKYDYSRLTTDELETLTELLAKCEIEG